VVGTVVVGISIGGAVVVVVDVVGRSADAATAR
jgi:hypothetical protein